MTDDDLLDLLTSLDARGITLRRHAGDVIRIHGGLASHGLRNLIEREGHRVVQALAARTAARRAIDSARFLSRQHRTRAALKAKRASC
jgi:hypothetical protein